MEQDRRTELEALIDDITLKPLIDEMLYLENKLEEVKKLPFIKVHPNDPTKQKATPAAKQYKELLQQYTNIIRLLQRSTGENDENEQSPLRKWFNERFSEE